MSSQEIFNLTIKLMFKKICCDDKNNQQNNFFIQNTPLFFIQSQVPYADWSDPDHNPNTTNIGLFQDAQIKC